MEGFWGLELLDHVKSGKKVRQKKIIDPWLLGNSPLQRYLWPIFGGFEGFIRLEDDIS